MINKKKFKKILSIIIGYILFIVPIAAAFKDVSSEVNEAAEKFAEEGLFGSFICLYGNDLFRPDGNVTRENLILLLSEYHILTQTLLRRNMTILSRVKKLEEKDRSTGEMDIENIKKILESMIRRSQIVQAINLNVEKASKTNIASGEIRELKEKIKLLDKKFEKTAKSETASKFNKKIVKDVNNLQNKISKLNKNVENLWELCAEIMETVALLDILSDELKIIKTKIADLEKDK